MVSLLSRLASTTVSLWLKPQPMRKACPDLNSISTVLRPEQPEDADFLSRLFAADAAPPLRRGTLSEDAVAHLVALQLRSRDAAYRAHYPDARFCVVECAGRRVGRLVEADEDTCTHVVDVAIDPAWRRRGVAAAVLLDAMARWAAAGRGGRARIFVGNDPSLALFAKLGFVGDARPGEAQVVLTWQPRAKSLPGPPSIAPG